MSVANQILVEFAPTLTPTRISVPDVESDKADVKAIDRNSSGFSRKAGQGIPLVQINGLIVPRENLLSFSLYQDDFMPSITLSFIDTKGTFGSSHLPIHTPIVSVYMASTNKNLKSVACDFIILSIRSTKLPGGSTKYDYTGELYVPNFNNNTSIAFPKMSSVDVMRTVAKKLGLGFATNEEKTDDAMTWINPNLSFRTFLQNVSDRAYKTEKSFFQVFIDRNYVLNFVNVEKRMAAQKGADVTYLAVHPDKFNEKRLEPNSIEPEISETPMVLSNSQSVRGTDLHIKRYSPASQNGNILQLESFRKRVQWYSHGDKNLEFFVEPISDLKPENGTEHQTPTLDDFTDNDVTKWIGVDYGNAHTNYKFARVINMHNERELSKNTLKVDVGTINYSVPRGSRVKVNIFNSRTEDMEKRSMESDIAKPMPRTNSATDEVLDERLSDFYYVKDVVMRYRGIDPDEPMVTELTLTKRNWKPAPEKKN